MSMHTINTEPTIVYDPDAPGAQPIFGVRVLNQPESKSPVLVNVARAHDPDSFGWVEPGLGRSIQRSRKPKPGEQRMRIALGAITLFAEHDTANVELIYARTQEEADASDRL